MIGPRVGQSQGAQRYMCCHNLGSLDHTWRIIRRCHVFGHFQVAIKQNDFSSLSHFEFIFRGRTRPPPILATEAAEGARRNPGPHGQAGSGAPQGASTWRSWDPALTSTDWALWKKDLTWHQWHLTSPKQVSQCLHFFPWNPAQSLKLQCTNLVTWSVVVQKRESCWVPFFWRYLHQLRVLWDCDLW